MTKRTGQFFWLLLFSFLLAVCSPPGTGGNDEIEAWAESLKLIEEAHSGNTDAIIEVLACSENYSGPLKALSEYYWLLRLDQEGGEVDPARLENARNAVGEYSNDLVGDYLRSGETPYIFNLCSPEVSFEPDHETTSSEEIRDLEYYAALDRARKNLDNVDAVYRVVELNRRLPVCEPSRDCVRDDLMANFMLFEAAVRDHERAIDDVWRCLAAVGPYEGKEIALYFWALKRKKAGLPVADEEIRALAEKLAPHERSLAEDWFNETGDSHPYSWMADYPGFAC